MTKQAPLSGYTISQVYTTHQELRHKAASADESEQTEFNFGWDWRWVDSSTFEVGIYVSIEPSKGRDEFIHTDVVGRFTKENPDTPVDIESFVTLQAVAILLPYARQFLTSLTVNSFYGPFYLPTLNVEKLMQGMDPHKATAVVQSVAKTAIVASDVHRRPDLHRAGDARKRK